MTIRLHCFGESGNAFKCALALRFTGLDWEAVKVDFFNGEARSEAFRTLNPMGEVPVLEDGELILTQSGVILDHIAGRTGCLGGHSQEDRREVLRWMLWDNHKFSGQIGTTRFLMNFLPEAKRPAEVIAFQQARLKSAYRVLNEHLAGRDWVAGEDLSIADLSLCGYLWYPEPFGFSRADWPGIDRWLGRIERTPGWQHPYDMMPGNPSERA